jgi:hypothetical protein
VMAMRSRDIPESSKLSVPFVGSGNGPRSALWQEMPSRPIGTFAIVADMKLEKANGPRRHYETSSHQRRLCFYSVS